jgi:hypothetical protein
MFQDCFIGGIQTFKGGNLIFLIDFALRVTVVVSNFTDSLRESFA